MHLKAIGARTNIANTWTAQQTFTALPSGMGVGDGSVYINPASANANETLFGVALNTASRFRIDEDGDVYTEGNVLSTNRWTLSSTGDRAVAYTSRPDGFSFEGASVGAYRMSFGAGIDSQVTLSAHLDQDDVLIKRDVDGDGGTYNEAGSVLTLQRDVTNVGTEAGNFLECQNAAAAILAQICRDGSLEISAGFGLDVVPQAQQAHIVDANGMLADITTKFNTLLADLEGYGLLADS